MIEIKCIFPPIRVQDVFSCDPYAYVHANRETAIAKAQVLGAVVHSQGPLFGHVQRNVKSSSVLVIGGLFDPMWIV